MEESEWSAFSITHVEYPVGDFIGKLLAIASLLPVVMFIGCVTLIIFRRDLHTMSFFLGGLLNEIINLILKNMICQLRPMTRNNLYTEYGMPSSHSQMMFFFSVYAVLFLLFRLHHNRNSGLEIAWKVSLAVGLIIAAFVVSYSRVYLLYHTWSQIFWGGLLGTLLAGLWFIVVHISFTPLFPIIASWRISEFLMIRDTSLIPNILWFEYTNARSENRTRNRKLTSMKSQ